MRHTLLAAASALGALAISAASTPVLAATNSQSGLVNVNLQSVTVQAPISVAVPVSVAADVCNIPVNVLGQQASAGTASCTATSNSFALNRAIAQSMTSGGGGATNQQSGLVNVNVQGLHLQTPISVAVPVGVAANVCNVPANVLATQVNAGSASCRATSTSTALNQAIARNLA